MNIHEITAMSIGLGAATPLLLDLSGHELPCRVEIRGIGTPGEIPRLVLIPEGQVPTSETFVLNDLGEAIAVATPAEGAPATPKDEGPQEPGTGQALATGGPVANPASPAGAAQEAENLTGNAVGEGSVGPSSLDSDGDGIPDNEDDDQFSDLDGTSAKGTEPPTKPKSKK